MVRLFGTTISETINAFGEARLGPPRDAPPVTRSDDKIKAIGRIIVSLVLIIISTFLIAANQGQSQSVGVATLGLVTGYWLK